MSADVVIGLSAVVVAIRDGEAAARAMHDHVIVQGDRFHDLIAVLRQTLA